ncbi:hypothetical protein [Winogradskyella alexanderae]|uniref:Uncharacterized protein n=1 Tax=Winogradskyella alexanderae TaxID=2877123 RepID=A0ABS7XV38_9FLAO|nr:hypothetical protein [Winogradskyella alexanderae]MCA0133892.1 hypothetical protein [Winogradskyella alexanderae]
MKELIGKRIWFARTSSLGANLIEKIYTATYIQIPFFWKDEFGNEKSRNFNLSAQWTEDNETLLDYYDLKLTVTDHEMSTGDFEKDVNQSIKKGLNSSISFNEFEIDQIQILSRNEIVDNEGELRYDEGILLINKNKDKILLSAELKCIDQVEFVTDSNTIEKRITELKKRKTLGNNV